MSDSYVLDRCHQQASNNVSLKVDCFVVWQLTWGIGAREPTVDNLRGYRLSGPYCSLFTSSKAFELYIRAGLDIFLGSQFIADTGNVAVV